MTCAVVNGDCSLLFLSVRLDLDLLCFIFCMTLAEPLPWSNADKPSIFHDNTLLESCLSKPSHRCITLPFTETAHLPVRVLKPDETFFSHVYNEIPTSSERPKDDLTQCQSETTPHPSTSMSSVQTEQFLQSIHIQRVCDGNTVL
jgi:hypothetical protein